MTCGVAEEHSRLTAPARHAGAMPQRLARRVARRCAQGHTANNLHSDPPGCKLHFMNKSAMLVASEDPRSLRRFTNAHRITVCAQHLALDHGVDGFTMDELAEAAEVSRRTLFNYFPSKDDAILGMMPPLDAERLAEFRAGGPTGRLIDDMSAVMLDLLRIKGVSRDQVALSRKVMEQNPRLMALAHNRFHAFAEEFMDEVRAREGSSFDRHRAQVAVALLASLFAQTLDAYVSGSSKAPLADLYAKALKTARELLV